MARDPSSASGVRGELTTQPLRLTALNWAVLGVAAGVILAGYVSLAAGSTVVAPLLLVLGYCVLIPLGIFL
jgi:hypothetical protein